MLLLGPPGVGKSFLVQAMGYQAIKAGFAVLYRSIFDVVRDFLHDEALGGEDKVLARYLKPDLLIIDDMGMKQLPKRSGEYLFEIIMRRYETRSTMMTSNRPLEDWGKLIGDVPSATAILDRFLHHAEIVQITGKSYRLRARGSQVGEAGEEAKPAKAPSAQPQRRKSQNPPRRPSAQPQRRKSQNLPRRHRLSPRGGKVKTRQGDHRLSPRGGKVKTRQGASAPRRADHGPGGRERGAASYRRFLPHPCGDQGRSLPPLDPRLAPSLFQEKNV